MTGIDSDRLNPPSQQAEPAVGITSADGLRVIESPYGHDGFLVEGEQVAALVRELVRADLSASRPRTRPEADLDQVYEISVRGGPGCGG